MREIGAYEAKTKLPELLRAAEGGESIRITVRGRPVARLVPDRDGRPDADKVVDAMLAFGKGRRLGDDLDLKELIEEGRR